MAIPVLMPRQGQSVESCIMGQWYKSVGDEVREGDLLFSYETDKSSFEEEAKSEGILLAIFYDEGDEVPVLTNVAVVGEKGESFQEFAPGNADSKADNPKTDDSVKQDEESPKVIEFDVVDDNADRKIRISPLAKNMAGKMGVDINTLRGTGPHGRIIARDIESASKTKQVQEERPAPQQPEPQQKPAAPKVTYSDG